MGSSDTSARQAQAPRDFASIAASLRDGRQELFFQAGGEWCYLSTPAAFRVGRPMPVVIHHHGAGGWVRDGSADWLEEDYKVAYLTALMEAAGCAVAGTHACGDHWGNDCAVAANAALFEVLATSPHIDAGRIGLMGGGLGGLLVWNSVLGPLAGRVRAVLVMQAVASIAAVVRERKFKAPCLKAYDLPAETPDDAAIAALAAHDPLPRLQRLAPGAPLPSVAIYHGGQDHNIPAATNAVPLAEALRRGGADVTIEVFPEVEHAVYEMGKPIEERLTRFFVAALR